MFRRVKRGQIYRAIKDVPMLGMVILKAAGSGGFDCMLPKGTKIVIDSDPFFMSKATYALPLNYKELEEKLVPLKEKQFSKYKEYVLSLNFKDLPNFIKESDGQEVKFDDDRIQQEWDIKTSKRRKNL